MEYLVLLFLLLPLANLVLESFEKPAPEPDRFQLMSSGAFPAGDGETSGGNPQT